MSAICPKCHAVLPPGEPVDFHRGYGTDVYECQKEKKSFIQLALHRVGIKAIRDAGGTLLLGSGDEEKKL